MAGQQWFRMYAEFATDPKVQMLSETSQRRFVMFLCLHCRDELATLSREHVAFALRVTCDELTTTIDELVSNDLIDPETLVPKAWEKRQFKSDTSTERTRRYRERQRHGNVTERHGDDNPERHSDALDTDTDTETEKKDLPSVGPKKPPEPDRSRGSRIVPASWQPKPKTVDDLRTKYQALDVDAELAKLRLHEYARPIRDFDRAFRRWCAKAEEFRQRDAVTPINGSGEQIRKGHAFPEDTGKW